MLPVDRIPPRLSCPIALSARTPKGKATAKVLWSVGVMDNSMNVDPNAKITVRSSHVPSQELPIGLHDVKVNATDQAGNVVICVFNIEVRGKSVRTELVEVFNFENKTNNELALCLITLPRSVTGLITVPSFSLTNQLVIRKRNATYILYASYTLSFLALCKSSFFFSSALRCAWRNNIQEFNVVKRIIGKSKNT